LFFFSEDRRFQISFPDSFSKLSHFQVDFDATFIKKVLKKYEEKVNVLNYRLVKEELGFSSNDLAELINAEFIVPDSSAIRFSELKSGFVPNNRESLVIYYENLYFKNYKTVEIKDHVNEQKILQQFHTKARNSFKESTGRYLREVIEVRGKFFKEKFDYGWQNGTFNLITPLSFDLQREDSIKRKIQQQIGVVRNLEEIIKKDNLKLDFIIARPTGKSLLSAFGKALDVLHDFEDSSLARVIEYGEPLDSYVEEIKNTAKPLIQE
tara:strand:+ start:3572 stop:4369 length:798 start_codon:yes stop_codon:yes gene_type:complete